MIYDELKKRFDAKTNKSMSYDFRLRIHRAISWGLASENEDRIDEKLIKLWISFNALYGSGFTEFSEVQSFLASVITEDKNNTLKEALRNKSHMIINFISIPELYDNYWIDENKTRIERENAVADTIAKRDREFREFLVNSLNADKILFDLFDLIYLLRNQIFHGSASYNSINNKSTKSKCIEILELFIPIIIDLMIDNPNNDWHEVKYKPLRNEKFIPETKEEKEIASKVSTWLRTVEKDGECRTSPLTKEKRHIVYKILEAKGIYEWDKYYPGDGTEGLIIRKKK